jgi:hypothetical protein
MQSFKNQIHVEVDDHLLIHRENLATMHQESYDKFSVAMAKMEQRLQEQAEVMETQFYQRYDQAMEAAIQEIHDCADDATDKFNMHLTVTMDFASAVPPSNATTSSRWNVDPVYRQNLEKLTSKVPFADQPTTHPEDTKQESTDPNLSTTWGKDGPGFQPTQ